MLSRTILVALASAACFATVNAAPNPGHSKPTTTTTTTTTQPTGGSTTTMCCNQVQSSGSLSATETELFSLLGIDVSALVGNIGINCINLLGNQCSEQVVSCSSGNGLIGIGCIVL